MDLIEELNGVINDITHQKDCVFDDAYESMWDTRDIDNWDSIENVLIRVKERLIILEEQNNSFWRKK